MGYVYLLLEVDKAGGERHKIGISKNHPNFRVKQLQTGNSNTISLITFYESDNYKKVERWVHTKHSNNKTEANNEWFNLTNEDVLSFIDTCKKANETISFLKDNNHFFK